LTTLSTTKQNKTKIKEEKSRPGKPKPRSTYLMTPCEVFLNLETRQKHSTQKKKKRKKLALSIFKKENLSLSIFQSEFLKINRKIGNCKISDGRLETTALLYYSLYSQSSSIFEDP